ncbi:ubiquitin-like [Amia ocellicauda]|uniref:ubiquitin-like n=1 Tax=Amia ocellicauda TaxID=2972642 RepID=UPI0034643F32
MGQLWSWFTEAPEQEEEEKREEESSPVQPRVQDPDREKLEESSSPVPNHFRVLSVCSDAESEDRLNLHVRLQGGKTIELDVFPGEMLASVKEEACRQANLEPDHMQLVFDGEVLDENKRVRESKLRRGNTLNLIRRA